MNGGVLGMFRFSMMTPLFVVKSDAENVVQNPCILCCRYFVMCYLRSFI
jgi:hypothetical protein